MPPRPPHPTVLMMRIMTTIRMIMIMMAIETAHLLYTGHYLSTLHTLAPLKPSADM